MSQNLSFFDHDDEHQLQQPLSDMIFFANTNTSCGVDIVNAEFLGVEINSGISFLMDLMNFMQLHIRQA